METGYLMSMELSSATKIVSCKVSEMIVSRHSEYAKSHMILHFIEMVNFVLHEFNSIRTFTESWCLSELGL